MGTENKKKFIVIAIGVSLAAIAAGFYSAGSLQPLLASQKQNDEQTNVVKTVRSVVEGNQKTTITKTVETIVHSHDDLPKHKHVVSVEVAVAETSPHTTFHEFPAAQTAVPTEAAGAAGNTTPDHAAHPAQGEASQGQEIMIIGREFIPGILTVPVGAKVTWVSKDSETHTVTSDTGLFNATLNPNGSFSFIFAEAGTFKYHCDNRPEMVGTITVK